VITLPQYGGRSKKKDVPGHKRCAVLRKIRLSQIGLYLLYLKVFDKAVADHTVADDGKFDFAHFCLNF
jgi:hypothetical protein